MWRAAYSAILGMSLSFTPTSPRVRGRPNEHVQQRGDGLAGGRVHLPSADADVPISALPSTGAFQRNTAGSITQEV